MIDELDRSEYDKALSLAVPRKEKFNPLNHQKRWLDSSNEKLILMKTRNPNSLMSANNPSKPSKNKVKNGYDNYFISS